MRVSIIKDYFTEYLTYQGIHYIYTISRISYEDILTYKDTLRIYYISRNTLRVHYIKEYTKT